MSFKRLSLFTLALVVVVSSAFLILTEPVFAGTSPSIGITEPLPIRPETGQIEASRPGLVEFRTTLDYGSKNTIVGIYAPGIFGLPVVQQPTSNPGFVSGEPESLTQFGLASDYGTLGFLAHNTLSGAHFFDLKVGQTLVLVYGDGSLKRFIISEQQSYQALSPNSPYSNFKDLNDTSIEITSTELFNRVYADVGKLIFQTCIESNGLDTWGRLFVIAVPARRIPHSGYSLLRAKGLSIN